MTGLGLLLICANLVVLVVAFIANGPRLLNVLRQISRWQAYMRGRGSRQVLGGQVKRNNRQLVRAARANTRPTGRLRNGGQGSEQPRKHIATEPGRYCGDWLNPRAVGRAGAAASVRHEPYIVPGVGNSEFPSLNKLLAQLADVVEVANRSPRIEQAEGMLSRASTE